MEVLLSGARCMSNRSGPLYIQPIGHPWLTGGLKRELQALESSTGSA